MRHNVCAFQILFLGLHGLQAGCYITTCPSIMSGYFLIRTSTFCPQLPDTASGKFLGHWSFFGKFFINSQLLGILSNHYGLLMRHISQALTQVRVLILSRPYEPKQIKAVPYIHYRLKHITHHTMLDNIYYYHVCYFSLCFALYNTFFLLYISSIV